METAKQIQNKHKKLSSKKYSDKEWDFVQHYLGTGKRVLGIKTMEVVKIAKGVVKEQGNIPVKKIIGLLDQLFYSNTFEEHVIGGKVFTFLKPEVREQIPFANLEYWLAKAKGWAEIDVICQSTFTGDEVLKRWSEWHKMIKKFQRSENISLRRASMVLQIPSNRKSYNKEMRRLAFETIETLKSEKEVLITKAVSWLLRCLVELDKEEVRQYLTKNEATLPRIAYRETIKKIETGRKTIKSRGN